MLRRTLFHATGQDPNDAELDIAVRREFAELSAQLRRGDLSLGGKPSLNIVPAPPTNGSSKTWLTAEQLHDAEAAQVYAQTHGVTSLFEAVRWFHINRGSSESAPRLEQCVDEFLCGKRAEGLAEMTVMGYRSKLMRFAAAFPDLKPADVSPNAIGQLIARAHHMTTRRDWWETLSTFYKWCIGVNYARVNPLPLALARPSRIPGAQLVLTPNEATAILRAAKQTDQIGFWALSLFAGLRTYEIRRLQKAREVWSLIRLESRVIDLPAAYSKTGARLVPISPVLLSWLKRVRARNVPLWPPNHFLKCRRLRGAVMAERISKLSANAKQAGRKPPVFAFNVARRSYISYRLATKGVTYADVAREVGNSEAVIRANYEHRVGEVDAKEYFSLGPNRV